MVVGFDTTPGLLNDIGIHRIPDVDFALLLERAGRHPFIPDILHVAEHGTLHHLEDHHHTLCHTHVFGVYVNEFSRPVQGANVVLNRLGIKDLAGAGDEFGEF